MTTLQHLTVPELETRFRSSKDVVEQSDCQVIWLVARGHRAAGVADLTALTPRWVSKLSRRYEEGGIGALGDQRARVNGAKPLLSREDLEALRERLESPPDDGGLWSGPKVARWMASRLGLSHVHAPRGWEALKKLGWSLQAPRPKNPKAATPEQEEAFKKSSPAPSRRKRPSIRIKRSRSGPRTSIGSA